MKVAELGARRAARFPLLAIALAGTVIVPLVHAPAARAQAGDPRLVRLGDEFLDHWFSRSPQLATRLGLHDRDDLLNPVTQASLEQDAAWLRDFRTRLSTGDFKALFGIDFSLD